jgi:coproporphyrinogen III oxidase-like Fe-S oxidoreductase
MDNELMLGFRKIDGININEFQEKYGISIYDAYPIKPLLKNKDLVLENNFLKINPTKIYVMNEILIKLI